MDAQVSVAVLLPTYNGEKYLAEQLDSLLGQSHKNLLIVIRDDGSSDGTVALINSYASRNPELIYMLDSNGENLGASGSFSLLIQYVLGHKDQLGLQQAYMMFCDQDDIWHQDKVSIQLGAMLEAESTGNNKPVMVHSDLQVVSATGQPIAESFMLYQGLEIERNRFQNLLVSNLVTGCTVCINEKLAELAVPVPVAAIMHDWWLALVCSAFGKLVYLDDALVSYRQHENNTLGAKQYHKADYAGTELLRKLLTVKSNPLLVDCAIQARAFGNRYDDRLNTARRCMIRVAAAMRWRLGVMQQLIFRVMRRL